MNQVMHQPRPVFVNSRRGVKVMEYVCVCTHACVLGMLYNSGIFAIMMINNNKEPFGVLTESILTSWSSYEMCVRTVPHVCNLICCS